MANTSFDEIYDLALTSFRDYKLNKLYDTSVTDFKNILQGYLFKAIPKFTNCKKNLEDFDSTTKIFNIELTLTEKVILSDFTVIEWMTPKILDITQMELHLSDTDFKIYSEQQNLKGKIEVQNILIERVEQQTTNYGIKNIPWSDWAVGNFGV
jgi:hypothetical protein